MNLAFAPFDLQLTDLIDRSLARVNTCVPGVVEQFHADTQTVDVTPAVMALDKDGNWQRMGMITSAPLVFPFASTAGMAITVPVRKGDPCLILFSQRCFEAWHEQGGVQPPNDCIIPRHHHLTDALVLLAPSPLPNVLAGWNTDGIEIRNRARDVRLTVSDAGVEAVVGGSSLFLEDAGVTITGNLTVTGKIETSGTPFVHTHTVTGGSTSVPSGTQV